MNNIMKQHFMDPKNMGKIKKPTHQSKCKSGFCGDTIELYAEVDPSGIVTNIKYNVFGCYAVIATASVLSEWAKGKTLAEIKSIDYDTIKDLIGGDPDPEKENCIRVAMKAFQEL